MRSDLHNDIPELQSGLREWGEYLETTEVKRIKGYIPLLLLMPGFLPASVLMLAYAFGWAQAKQIPVLQKTHRLRSGDRSDRLRYEILDSEAMSVGVWSRAPTFMVMSVLLMILFAMKTPLMTPGKVHWFTW